MLALYFCNQYFLMKFAVDLDFGLAIDCNRDSLIGCNEPAMDNNLKSILLRFSISQYFKFFWFLTVAAFPTARLEDTSMNTPYLIYGNRCFLKMRNHDILQLILVRPPNKIYLLFLLPHSVTIKVPTNATIKKI